MNFTSSILLLLIREIKGQIVNQKISDICKDKYDFQLSLYPSRRSLFFSLHPAHVCMFLSERPIKIKKDNSPFLLLLKKHISGCTIRDIKQINFDRVAELILSKRITMEDEKELHLYIELIHRYSNAILTDEKDRILGTFKSISAEQNRFRSIIPGTIYVPPPVGNKINPLAITKEEFLSAISVPPKWNKTFTGMDKDTIKRLKETQAYASKEELWNQFDAWRRELLETNPTRSISSEIETSFKKQAEEEKLNSIRNKLTKEVKKAAKQLKKKLNSIEEELRESASFQNIREMAETLLIHKNSIPTGARELSLPSIYDASKILQIQIDPSLPIEKSIENMFKRYKKLKKKQQILPEAKAKLLSKLSELQQLEEKIKTSNLETLKEMDKEAGKTVEKAASRLPYRELKVRDWRILIGKNSKTNEILTLKIANKNDLWFHTKHFPGSHVILRVERKEEPHEKIINIAAQIAAFYSKAAEGTKVAVDYTRRKYIRKPPKTPEGFVTYKKYKTLVVKKAQALEDILQNP